MRLNRDENRISRFFVRKNVYRGGILVLKNVRKNVYNMGETERNFVRTFVRKKKEVFSWTET